MFSPRIAIALAASCENDGRVSPYMSGHGQGMALSERVEQAADVYTFLFTQLGMEMPAK